MQQQIILQAGVWSRMDVRGRLFVLLDQGAANVVALKFFKGTHELETIEDGGKGFRARMQDGVFDRIDFKADAGATVKFVVTENAIDFDWFEGSRVHVITSLADPLYVTQVGVPAGAIGDAAAVAVTDALTAVIAADATRAVIRFYNQGPDPVALGGAALTWAKRCVVLGPGDQWVEDDAANLAWSAICDAGQTASVTTQVVTV